MRGWTLEEGEEQPAQFWTPPATARPPRPAPHPITLQNQSVLSTSRDAGLSLVLSRPSGSALPAPTALREHRCWTSTPGLSSPKVWILSPESEVSNSELQPLSQTQDCQLQAPPEDVLVPDFSPLQPGIPHPSASSDPRVQAPSPSSITPSCPGPQPPPPSDSAVQVPRPSSFRRMTCRSPGSQPSPLQNSSLGPAPVFRGTQTF